MQINFCLEKSFDLRTHELSFEFFVLTLYSYIFDRIVSGFSMKFSILSLLSCSQFALQVTIAEKPVISVTEVAFFVFADVRTFRRIKV